MLLDPDRLTAAIAGLWGGVFFALFHLVTTLAQGQAVATADIVRAVVNVLAGIAAGVMAAYFLGVALSHAIPWTSMRDLHTIGFGLGAVTWVLTPFAYGGAKDVFAAWVGKKAREAGQ